MDAITYNEPPHRFEAGTPPIVQAIGLGYALDYMEKIGREAITEVFGLEMIEDEWALRTLRTFFASRGIEMVEANRKQAMVPVGAEVLPNPNGTAPGLYLPPRMSGERNCAVFLLPGPPSEIAVATPAMLPIPTVAERAVVRAWK